LVILGWATFGLVQSVNAAEVFNLANLNTTLSSWSPAVRSEQPSQASLPYSDDSAVSALSNYARQIGSEAPKPISLKAADIANNQFDDQAYAALRAFAQRLGPTQTDSIKNQPKLADADNALDALREFLQKGSSTAPAEAPKAPAAAPKPKGPPVEAHFVGMKVCLGCHASQAESFSHTLMGRIGQTQKGKFDCENCHGAGSAHVKAGGGRGVGGIISFRPEDQSRTAEENNAVCLTCHERGDRTNWQGSTHESRGLMCTNCHTVMKTVSRKNQLKTATEPETCFQCHKDRKMQMMRSSHMPLREGKMVCSDCHNPHGSVTEAMLRADSINDTCYKCHAEKRGPFLFEHAPVRENCDNCHEPHGSANEFLLKVARPRLCTECHTFGHGGNDRGPKFIQGFSRSCNNCHTEVHGTNSPSGALLHR
jgi:DmsE family decaheme c-type cytochrome